MPEISKESLKGIWIPIEILKLKDLSQTEKLLLAAVISLDKGDGCYATNKYFSEILNVSKDRITRIISKLAQKNYLKISLIYENDSKRVKKRILTDVNLESSEDLLVKIPRQSPQKSLDRLGENAYTPPGVKYEEYNKELDKKEDIIYSCCKSLTSNVGDSSKTTSSTKTNKKFDADSEPYLLAKYLEDQIREHSPQVKESEANRQRWAQDIDKMIRIDKINPDDIAAVICWCQHDSFWKCNILSGKKLREKYMQLDIKMKSERR